MFSAYSIQSDHRNECFERKQKKMWSQISGSNLPNGQAEFTQCGIDNYILRVKVKSVSCVQLFGTPWTVAYQDPQSMGFSRQECWSGLPFPSPDLPDPGIEPGSPSLQADALPSEPPGMSLYHVEDLEICLQCRRPWFDFWVRKICWRRDRLPTPVFLDFPYGLLGKESTCNVGDLGLIPGVGRSPGEAKCYPLLYSGLENSMDCIGHGVTKRWT